MQMNVFFSGILCQGSGNLMERDGTTVYIYRVYFMVFSSFGKVVFQVSPRLVWRTILLAAYSRVGNHLL